MSFHAADPKTSDRTGSVLRALKEAGDMGITSMELADKCNVVNPAGAASECRKFGYTIDCKYQGRSSSGRKIHRFWLRG